MTKKEIRQKYCDKRNYTSWNKYNITEYSKWLENELIKTQKKVKKLTLTDVVVPKGTYCDCTDEPMRLAMSLTKCASCQKIVKD